MTTVQNAAGVVLDPVVGPVRGTVTLTGRIVNASGSATIAFQASTVRHEQLVRDPRAAAPAAGLVRTCQVDTTSITGYYDWRAVGVVNGTTYYDIESHVLVDNTAADRDADRARRAAERDREHDRRRPATRTAASRRCGSSTARSVSPPGPPARSTPARRTPAA